MGRKKKVKTLNVSLNKELVGKLIKETSGSISFVYDEDWIEKGFAISNSLPLQEDTYRGEIVSRYFDNLLPDNEDIKKQVAIKFGAESLRPFDMLEVIGKDCVGALSFTSENSDIPENFDLIYSPLSEQEIARRIRGLDSVTPLGMDDNDFRISIAGAQGKTAFLSIDGKWSEPHGLTPTTHIFKTSIGALGENINFDDSIDNEWGSLRIMKKMGLPVCETHIEQFEDQRVLVVKRFDRDWVQFQRKKTLIRKPQEDLCQALGKSPYQKYESDGGPGIIEIAQFLMASKNEHDRYNFFKALVVFDLLYATDGHAKNFSIFLERDGFKMTPFYDVMGAYFLAAREKRPWNKMKLAMKVGDSGHYRFSKISRRHYEQTAKACGLTKEVFEKIMSELSVCYQNLSFHKKELDSKLKQETLEIIVEGIKKRSAILFGT